MLGLVLADNLVMLYVFWELVGMCSYLLIGFWFQRPSAAAAAKKAFIVTRLGDLGFLIAILITYTHTGTFTIPELFTESTTEALTKSAFLGWSALTWVALGLFAGAVGKSAQFPLHVWLPDAMEGPTPVSALIHAATMVAAGVYLVGRMLPLFAHSTEAMTAVAVIGGFTAIFAASMGLVMNDIKRVMAYSTVSQLGYMMLALGVGGYVAAFFHLFNHAFFKALLFLCSGSVNHATGTFDMRYMGGLRKAMPWTFWTIVIASLSLAGIPPFSGFWSKDEILLDALVKSPALFALALTATFMTAFYVFRAVFLTFSGEYRGGSEAEALALHGGGGASDHSGDSSHHSLHESPAVMVIPLAVLAVPAVLSGLVNLPGNHWLADFLLTPSMTEALGHGEAATFNIGLAAVATVVSAAGILLAYLMYGAKSISPEAIGSVLNGRPYRILSQKYGMDHLYANILIRGIFYRGLSLILSLFDTYVVDGLVNLAGALTRGLGAGLRRIETGQVQMYGLVIFIGVVVITATFMITG
ncbi:MAG: nuoL [Dehalococcoidia bacterium]|nr:nuoL [Dehalococcoidia bacterium]